MEFLLILIFFIFILPRLLVRIAAWYLRRKTRRAFRDFASQFEQQFTQPSPEPERPSKMYAPTDGEYVDYEEISVTATETTQTTSTTEHISVTTEQIVDVEWEDIK